MLVFVIHAVNVRNGVGVVKINQWRVLTLLRAAFVKRRSRVRIEGEGDGLRVKD